MSNMEQMQIVPKQKEANGQTQFWRRVVSVSINTGKISKLEGVQILECWQAADLKHESDQKSITFASLLCGKFGTSKGSALYSTMKEVRSEVLQQIKHRRSTVSHWEPSTVATIMMNNFLEELENVVTQTSKADMLHRVLILGWEYLNAADEQKLFSVLRPEADITKAMSLSTIKAKLYHQQYASLDAFAEDVRFMLDSHAALSPAPEDTKVTTGLLAAWKTFCDAAQVKLSTAPPTARAEVSDYATEPAHKKQKWSHLDRPDAENHENVALANEEFASDSSADIPHSV